MAATGPINDLIAPKASATEKAYDAGHNLPSSSARYSPDNLPAGVARIVTGARRLFEVRTMQEHVDLMNSLLARDVTWDAPPILISSREDMRVAVYLAKSIATLTLEPALVSVQPLGNSRTIIDIEGTAYVAPKRSWLVPLSLLLPVSIGIRATIRLGVRGPLDTGRIELIDGQWHNLPRFPTLIREFNGLMMGSLPHLTEPWWSRGLEYVGDDYYKRQRLGLQRQHPAAAAAAAAADGVAAAGSVNGRGQ
ncbi:hypothetical protein OEZ85_013842 [Tetradesmus obliquus]|uniref:SMP-LTD domain-containing protein n=1 Tax=Tetradesmus obliquus TaxID=3088 RepID=A0ABY8U634_TETOB|nr:hypothetical protein OEZ85_013842 [Tetradesmus obliquus]